jgi:hypothetical protein
MSFRIRGLSPAPFQPLYGLSDGALARLNVRRMLVTETPGFPDRIEMRDVEPGQTVLLLNHVCQPADNPYRASHAIFVREGASDPYDAVDEVPEVMASRLLSLRAYDADHMMVDADVSEGRAVEAVIDRLLANPAIAYIHAHNAKRGCYSGRIDRA